MKLTRLEEFLEAHPDITLLGFAWSCYWRLWVAFIVGYLGFVLVFGTLALFLGALD